MFSVNAADVTPIRYTYNICLDAVPFGRSPSRHSSKDCLRRLAHEFPRPASPPPPEGVLREQAEIDGLLQLKRDQKSIFAHWCGDASIATFAIKFEECHAGAPSGARSQLRCVRQTDATATGFRVDAVLAEVGIGQMIRFDV